MEASHPAAVAANVSNTCIKEAEASTDKETPSEGSTTSPTYSGN